MEKSFSKQISSPENIKICAITGGIGAGKSEVAKLYADLGFPVINTDILAKKLISSSKKIQEELKREFGNEIFDNSSILNSQLLSSIVFTNDEEGFHNLEKLNKIVHPVVISEMIKEIEKLIKAGNQLIFVESALVYEAALDDGFDFIIVIDAEEKFRIKRTAERLKLSEEEVRIRNREQISTDVKKNLADFVIENNGTIEEMLTNAAFILELIKMA